MAYIGRQQDGFGVRSRFIYTATGGQTTFTTDDSSNALSYSDGAYVDVYLNGVLLDPSDYTATSLTSIVLDSGASADDVLEVIVYDVFSVFSGTFTNGITASEATVSGDLTVDTNTLYVDSTNNRVGVANASPATALDVTGTITGDGLTVDGDVLINSNSGTNPALITRLGNIDQSLQISVDDDSVIFKSEQDEVGRFGGYKFISRNAGTDTERLVIDLDGNVGIGTSSPSKQLHQIRTGSASDLPTLAIETGFITQSTNVAASSQNISIISGNGGEGRLFFGDTDDEDVGGIVYSHVDNSMTFDTAGSERMRIDSSGRVGIGTSSPVSTSKLDVRGRIQVGNSDDVSMASDARGHIRIQGNGYGGAITCDATGMHVYHNASGKSLVFGTNDTERARIDTNGSLMSNTTTDINYAQTSGNGNLVFRADTGSAAGSLILANNADRGWSMVYANKFAYSSGDDRRYINWHVNGSGLASIQLNSAGTQVEYNTGSDRRLKENIVDIDDGITRIKQLQPRKYNWVGTDFNAEGFIADEADGIVPEVVKGDANAVDEDGNPIYQQIEYSKFTPLLTAALQEAIAKIETLEAKVTALENA